MGLITAAQRLRASGVLFPVPPGREGCVLIRGRFPEFPFHNHNRPVAQLASGSSAIRVLITASRAVPLSVLKPFGARSLIEGPASWQYRWFDAHLDQLPLCKVILRVLLHLNYAQL
jgi:hypothetical protein